MADGRSVPDFSEASTHPVLAEACAVTSLDATGAELLRLGENAIYRLATAPVVVRIARSMDVLDDVRKEMRVARWLAGEGFPAAQLIAESGDDALIIRDRYPVTFWRLIRPTEPDPDEATLGALLRELHQLDVPSWVQLPPFTPFARVADRLDAAPGAADPDDVAFLVELLADLQQQYKELNYIFQPSAVHGDAHLSNLLRDESGTVLMLDFEAFAFGQREWDLTVTAIRRDGFAWMTDDEYRAFTDAYGYDIHAWPGFHVFRAIRELTMTTWLMQLTGDPSASAEFHRRVNDIRSDRFPRRWQPF